MATLSKYVGPERGVATISYVERPGSPRESYSQQGGARVQRIFDVSWEDRWYFCRALLGFSLTNGAGSLNYITRITPEPYPGAGRVVGGSDETYWLFAHAIESIEPIGPGGKDISQATPGMPTRVTRDADNTFTYQKARITVSYESAPYKIIPTSDFLRLDSVKASNTTIGSLIKSVDLTPVQQFLSIDPRSTTNFFPDESCLARYVSRHVQPTAEHLTLPFGQMLYQPDAPLPPGQKASPAINGIGRIIPNMELQYIWHQVPAVPNHILKYLGTVNLTEFVDRTPSLDPNYSNNLGKSYAVGTLLLVAIEVKPYRQITGAFAYDIVYRMKHFSALKPPKPPALLPTLFDPEKGHNYFIRFKNIGTLPDGTEGPVYQYELLNTSFDAGNQPNGIPVFYSTYFQNLFRLTEYTP